MKIDSPSVMESRTPEQNISALKGWGDELGYLLTMKLTEMEEEIESLKSQIEELKEAQNGV